MNVFFEQLKTSPCGEPGYRKGRRPAFWIGVVVLLGGLAGCYTMQVERAFQGEFEPYENNRIINEYCLSCHLHRNFNSTTHVEEVSLKYNRKVFRYATECRVCHLVERHWYLNDFIRKTRRPQEANQGVYEEFERDYLESQKQNPFELPGNPS